MLSNSNRGLNLPCTGDDGQIKIEATTIETQQFEQYKKSTQEWLQSTDVSPVHPNRS